MSKAPIRQFPGFPIDEAESMGVKLSSANLPTWISLKEENPSKKAFVEEITNGCKITLMELGEGIVLKREKIILIHREFSNNDDMTYRVISEAIHAFMAFV